MRADQERPPDRRRTIPVRVADIPQPVRVKAARQAVKDEHDPDEALRIMLLAHDPGDLVAWIAA